MTPNGIRYRRGYKYQLAETYSLQTALRTGVAIITPYVDLDVAGTLTIREGYAWDGASGPAIDTRNFLRGSLVHDTIYQLIRLGLLPRAAKDTADLELVRICEDDGMCAARRWWVYKGVHNFGTAYPSNEPLVYSAP